MIVDVYGTADETGSGIRDAMKKESWWTSPEYVQYYRHTGYKDILYSFGKRKADTHRPSDVVQETSRIYIKLFEMITGEKFKAKI